MLSEAAFHARVQAAFADDKEAGSAAAHALYGALWTLICDAKVNTNKCRFFWFAWWFWNSYFCRFL
jgi:hypothetical protein